MKTFREFLTESTLEEQVGMFKYYKIHDFNSPNKVDNYSYSICLRDDNSGMSPGASFADLKTDPEDSTKHYLHIKATDHVDLTGVSNPHLIKNTSKDEALKYALEFLQKRILPSQC